MIRGPQGVDAGSHTGGKACSEIVVSVRKVGLEVD